MNLIEGCCVQNHEIEKVFKWRKLPNKDEQRRNNFFQASSPLNLQSLYEKVFSEFDIEVIFRCFISWKMTCPFEMLFCLNSAILLIFTFKCNWEWVFSVLARNSYKAVEYNIPLYWWRDILIHALQYIENASSVSSVYVDLFHISWKCGHSWYSKATKPKEAMNWMQIRFCLKT